jgi:hypothetical protein
MLMHNAFTHERDSVPLCETLAIALRASERFLTFYHILAISAVIACCAGSEGGETLYVHRIRETGTGISACVASPSLSSSGIHHFVLSRCTSAYSRENTADERMHAGGGIYYYWQAGAAIYLQERFDLEKAKFAGTSALCFLYKLIV